jgi:hypothetical protein
MDMFEDKEFALIIFLPFLIGFIPYIFFLLSQQQTLLSVEEHRREMKPWKVWLQLVPLVGFVWQFFVVRKIANSLQRELEARNSESHLGLWDEGMGDEVNLHPTFATGQWYCIMVCVSLIPFVGFITFMFAFILWISYWSQLIKYRNILSL